MLTYAERMLTYADVWLQDMNLFLEPFQATSMPDFQRVTSDNLRRNSTFRAQVLRIRGLKLLAHEALSY
jgi:hypothetical protein